MCSFFVVSLDGYNEFTSTSCLGEDLLQSVTLTMAECEARCDSTIGCIAFRFTEATSLCAIRAQCQSLLAESGVSAYIKAGMICLLTPPRRISFVKISKKKIAERH